MGSIVARDLANRGYGVTVADSRELYLGRDIKTVKANLRDYQQRARLVAENDLVVCALPSELGYAAVKSIIEAGKLGVDLSYCTENLLELNGEAKKNGSLIINDAGAGPGITNLTGGRALYTGRNRVIVYIGGFAKDENAPLGYAVSWSTEDLLDEYVRPARLISAGEIETVPALSLVETIDFPCVGSLDAFATDGLRTILDYKCKEIRNRKATIIEKTMRRSGHMEEMIELIESGKFVDFVNNNCVGLEDVLAMRIDADGEIVDLLIDSDERMSAMARSTALSCSAFIQMIAEGKVIGSGIIPPEVLAENDEFYVEMLDRLAENGLKFSERYPFL